MPKEHPDSDAIVAQSIRKSPSALFAILTENDDVKRRRSEKQSIDELRVSLSQRGEQSTSSEDRARGSNAAQAALGTPATDGAPAAQAQEGADTAPSEMNENVLQSMLGPLYLKYGSLSDFEELGEGGFATVHRAKYKHSNGMTQIVAVKQLLKARVSDRDDLRDFIAEANLWRKLKSKDIVKLVGIGAADLTSFDTITSSMYIVCEYMEGGTLREAVERQMLSSTKAVYHFSDVFRWFIGISRGVKYLHSCRPTIVHRDLKPENIMLTGADMSSNEAKVLDLGLHTRKTARHTLPGEMDGSWYGGTSYDAVKFNGSVYAGRGKTLADKVREVETASNDSLLSSNSPPQTNTKHSGSTAHNALKPIVEEASETGQLARDSTALHDSTPDPADASEQDALVQVTAGESDDRGSSKNSSAVSREKGAPTPRDAVTTLAVEQAAPLRGGGGSGGGVGALGMPRNASNASMQASSRTSSGAVSPITVPASTLTTKVGSWLYMAPEMVSGNKYSEKVDVYAMAVMLYEALNFRLNVMKLALGREPKAISDYADEVSKGHREQIPKSWPVEVRSLLEGAWEQDCDNRLTASDFLTRISEIIDNGVAQSMDDNYKPVKYNAAQDCGCGTCCSVM